MHVSDAGLVGLFLGVIPLQLRDVFLRPPRPETKTVLLAIIVPPHVLAQVSIPVTHFPLPIFTVPPSVPLRHMSFMLLSPVCDRLILLPAHPARHMQGIIIRNMISVMKSWARRTKRSQVERVAAGIGGLARWGMLINPKLRGHTLWQMPLDGVHTDHGHDAPLETTVLIAHRVQIKGPLQS